MSASIAEARSARHRLSLENPEFEDLRNLETLREAVGRAVERARRRVGWTQDELAGEIAKVLQREKFDAAQVARWEAGKERPQFDVLLAIPKLRWPLIQCIALIDEAVEVITEIRRSSARRRVRLRRRGLSRI
jgi:transcriptional regulator with XRE-family HTH domain